MILLQFLQLTTIRMDMVIPTIMDMVMVMLTGLRWWASSESGLKLRTGGAYWWREGGGGKKRAREGGWVGE